MTNNIPDNSKLDEAVKKTLSSYEAPFDGADWSRMESMLDAAPKSSNFKWSYAIGAVLGLAVIGGGYFAYTNYTNKQNTAVSSAPAPKTQQVVTPAPKPVATAAPVTTPPPAAITAPDPEATPTVTATTTASTSVPAMADKTNKPADAATTKTPLAKEDKTKTKKQSTTANPDADLTVHQHVAGMGNEPVFGDMLDSSRGIIGETKEKDETKKAAKAKKDVPVGWNAFMLPNVNTDSLRKYKNMRDSLKVN